MTHRRLLLDGETLSLEEIREVARGGVHVELAPEALARVERARALADDELASTAPGQAIASALHEALYSRLFRS